MKFIGRTHPGIRTSGLFENYSFLLYVIFHNPSTPVSVTTCSLDGIQVRIFWKTLMIEYLFSSFLTDDVLLIFVRYEPYWEESMNKYEWMESIQDILQIMSHISPMTRAALRPVTATAVCVLLLILAAFSQLPQSRESSRSIMMVTSGRWGQTGLIRWCDIWWQWTWCNAGRGCELTWVLAFDPSLSRTAS